MDDAEDIEELMPSTPDDQATSESANTKEMCLKDEMAEPQQNNMEIQPDLKKKDDENVTINDENVTINDENVTINDENMTIHDENTTRDDENVEDTEPKGRKTSRKSSTPFRTPVTNSLTDESDDEERLVIVENNSVDENMEEEINLESKADTTETTERPSAVHTRNYLCPKCPLATTSATDFLYHQIQEHGADFDVYECRQCSYATRYKAKLIRHYKTVHDSDKIDIDNSPMPATNGVPYESAISISGSDGSKDGMEINLIPADADPPLRLQSKESGEKPREERTLYDIINKEIDALSSKDPTNNNVSSVPVYPRIAPKAYLLPLADGTDEKQNTAPPGAKNYVMLTNNATSTELYKSLTIQTAASPDGEVWPQKMKRPPRTEVEGWKYLEIQTNEGIRFGCSKCGNVYKWKKSVNKHWKEKHEGEGPPDTPHPPNLTALRPGEQLLHIQKDRTVYPNKLPRLVPKGEPPKPYSPYSASLKDIATVSSINGSKPKDIQAATESPYTQQHKERAAIPQSVQSSFRLDKTAPLGTEDNPEVLDLSVGPSSRMSTPMSERQSVSPPEIISYSKPAQDEPLDFSMKPTKETIPMSVAVQSNDSNFKFQGNGLLESPITHQCSHCQMKFKWGWELQKHIQNDHNILSNKSDERSSPAPAHLSPNNSFGANAMVNSHMDTGSPNDGIDRSQMPYPYKCRLCNFKARWPSEITQHMKNHSREKPYQCPRCKYRSKWKWDVVKHMKRCGTGEANVKDVIDLGGLFGRQYFKSPSGKDVSGSRSSGPPNVTVMTASPMMSYQNNNNTPTTTTTTTTQNTYILPSPPSEVSVMGDPHTDTSPDNKFQSLSALSKYHIVIAPDHQKEAVQKKSFTGLQHGGRYHCLQCPFSGQSTAELKRHQAVHSEDKPYTCSSCSYRSKWKCDLKKHCRMYNHAPAPRPFTSIKEMHTMNEQDEREEQEKANYAATDPVFRCSKCLFVTRKKQFYDSHVKIHESQKTTPSKFRCKTCDYQAKDLSSFLQHKLTHSTAHAESVVSEDNGILFQSNPTGVRSSNSQESNDKSHKLFYSHFKCNKCPYSTQKKEDLETHTGHHGEREGSNISCFYCDFNVKNRSMMIQHMKLHPEYMQDSLLSDDGNDQTDDQDIEMKDNSYDTSGLDTSSLYNKWNMELSKDATDQTNEPPSTVHMSSQPVFPTPMEVGSQSIFPTPQPLEQFEARPYVTEEPKTSFLNIKPTNYNETNLNMSRVKYTYTAPQNQRMAAFHGKRMGAQMYRCSQCPYKTMSKVGYHKHKMTHDMKSRFFCPWCDWNAKYLSSVYRHCKAQHGSQMDLVEKKQFFNTVRVYTKGKLADRVAYQSSLYLPKNQNKMEDKNIPSDNDTNDNQEFDDTEGLDDIDHSGDATSNSLRSGEETNTTNNDNVAYFNVPQTEEKFEENDPRNPYYGSTKVLIKRKLLRKCIKCGYITDNPTNIRRHLAKHGQNYKYKCKFCDYSLDRLNLMFQHLKGVHSISDSKLLLSYVANPDYRYMASKKNKTAKTIITPEPQTYPNANTNPDNTEAAPVPNGEEASIDYNGDIPPVRSKRDYTRIQVRGHSLLAYISENHYVYACDKCPYENSNSTNCIRHLTQHGNNKKFMCEICDYGADNIKLINAHMRLHDAGDEVEMNDDSSTFTPPFENDVMDNNDTEMKMELQEETTDIEPDNKAIFYSKSGKMKCQICPFETRGKDAYYKHVDMHGYEGKYVCSHCNYGIDRLNLLFQHLRHHGIGASIADRDNYKMTNYNNNRDPEYQSTMSSSNKNILKLKLKPVPFSGMKRNFKCLQCPYSTSNKHNLIRHKTQHQFSRKLHSKQLGAAKQSLTEPPNIQDNMEPPKLELQMHIPNKNNDNNDNTAISPGRESRMFKCKQCPYHTNSSLQFRNHNHSHSALLKYSCDYCSFSAEGLNEINSHRIVHANEHGFRSEQPRNVFLNEEFILLNNKDEMNKESDMEDETSYYENNPELSMIADDSSIPHTTKTKQAKYNCTNCPYSCNNRNTHNVHMTMHGTNRKFVCDFCDWSIDRMNLLYQHRRVHSNQPGYVAKLEEHVFLNKTMEHSTNVPVEKESEPPQLTPIVEKVNPMLQKVAPVVEKITPISEKITPPEKEIVTIPRAITSHGAYQDSSQEILECSICPFACTDRLTFSQHKRCHDVLSKFICSHCSFSVGKYALLIAHMTLHEEDTGTKQMDETTEHKRVLPKRVKCPKCPYHTHSKALLESHSKMHNTTHGKYACANCPDTFDRENLLQQHMKTHVTTSHNTPSKEPVEAGHPDEKVHTCDKCPYTTTKTGNMKTHRAQHGRSGMKLKCDYCDYASNRRDLIQNHIKVHKDSDATGQDDPVTSENDGKTESGQSVQVV